MRTRWATAWAASITTGSSFARTRSCRFFMAPDRQSRLPPQSRLCFSLHCIREAGTPAPLRCRTATATLSCSPLPPQAPPLLKPRITARARAQVCVRRPTALRAACRAALSGTGATRASRHRPLRASACGHTVRASADACETRCITLANVPLRRFQKSSDGILGKRVFSYDSSHDRLRSNTSLSTRVRRTLLRRGSTMHINGNGQVLRVERDQGGKGNA
eukprot:6176912-Pleurochrysis_carterae.AAC.2